MRAAALPPQPRRGDPWADAEGAQGAAPAPAGAACSARHSSSLRLDGGRGEREQQRDATGLDGVEVRDRERWREKGTIQRDTEWEGSES